MVDEFCGVVFLKDELHYAVSLQKPSIELGLAFGNQLFDLIHKHYGDISASCAVWKNCLQKTKFAARCRYEGTTAWYVWESSPDEDEENDDSNDDAHQQNFSYGDHAHGFYSEHPLNDNSNDLTHVTEDLSFRSSPLELKTHAIPSKSIHDLLLLNVCGVAVSWVIDLDAHKFGLNIGTWVRGEFEHDYRWPMKSLYRFYLHFRSEPYTLCAILEAHLKQHVAWRNVEPMPTVPAADHSTSFLSQCAAIAIQTQARRYLVWKSGFVPVTGVQYKKARRSFEDTVSGLKSAK